MVMPSQVVVLRRTLLLARTADAIMSTSAANALPRATASHYRAATSTLPRRALFSSAASVSDPQVQQRGRLRDERILAHIVCPISKFPLRYDVEQGALICDEIHVAYPIRYGVPMLVPSEARIISHEQDNEDTTTPALS